jgi:hypothetical protein
MSTPTERPHGTTRGTRQKGSPPPRAGASRLPSTPGKVYRVRARAARPARGRRASALVCDRGDDPVEALPAAAKRLDLSAASLTGIGAFSVVTLGFFDRARRDYTRRVIRGRSRWCR